MNSFDRKTRRRDAARVPAAPTGRTLMAKYALLSTCPPDAATFSAALLGAAGPQARHN